MFYKYSIIINSLSSLALINTYYISYNIHIYIEILLFLWKVCNELYFKRLTFYTYDLLIHHSLFIFACYYTLFITPHYLYLLSISQIIHFPLMFYYLYKETKNLRYLKTYEYIWPITYYRDYKIFYSYYYHNEFILLPIGFLLLFLDIKWSPKYNLCINK